MSQGGTIKAQLEAVDKELDAEGKRWEEARLIGIRSLYRMNDDEFMHHCHLLAISDILMDKLGMSEDEITLFIKRRFLKETKKFFDVAQEVRRNSLRDAIVDGIGLIPPKIDPE